MRRNILCVLLVVLACVPQSWGATRLYFTQTAATVSPAYGSWGNTAEASRFKLSTVKGTSTVAAGTRIGPWSSNGSALDRQYISEPLFGAQTISGTLHGYVMSREYSNADDVTSAGGSVKVFSNDGTILRGTIGGGGGFPAELTNNASHRNEKILTSNVTLINAQPGDRIVIEIGYSDSNGSTPEASSKWGENAADCPQNETNTTTCAGWVEFSANLVFQGSGPAIYTLSPASGLVGQSVTIAGANFGATQGASTVTFNGVTATPTSWSATSITAPAPAGATTGPVVVTVGGQSSNGVAFTVLIPPNISNLDPSAGPVGQSVTITGTAFGSTQGSSTVTFNGVTATPTNWSATSITAPVPSSATTGPVVVTVSGLASNGVTFTVVTTGTIAGTVTRATDGTPIDGALVEALQASVVTGSATTPSNGTYSIPSLQPGTYDVRVTKTGFFAHFQSGVSVAVAQTTTVNVALTTPTINNLSTNAGPIDTPVTITGVYFGATQGTSTVKFNGIAAPVTSWSATSISTKIPQWGTTGPVVVTVGGLASNGVNFTVQTTGTLDGTITRASDSTPLAGALVEALQSESVKGSSTSLANGSYSIANLNAGTYDVRVSASTFGTQLRPSIPLVGGSTTTIDVAMPAPSTIAGRVTQADGTTPIAGASVRTYVNTTTAGTATTNGSGDYTISGLGQGSYAVEASAANYVTKSKTDVATTAGATTTVDFSLEAVGVQPIRYIYDELGRLVGVVDQAGDTATYNYDAVGNILSITRRSSSQVSIIEFSPNSGPVGATVTVSGTGFSSTPSQNTLTFNGVAATVTTANATELVTTVPAGATTGPIAVTTPTGSATSSTNFVVTASTGAPTITGFTPTMAVAGTAVNMTGANFSTPAGNNILKFNNTYALVGAVTATSIDTTVPSAATSGHITVTTPAGTAVSSDDFFIPPTPYGVADVGFTGRMSLGSTGTITLSQPDKIGLMLFDGIQGHRVSFQFTNITLACASWIEARNPDTTKMFRFQTCSSTAWVDPKPMLHTGTYTIMPLPYPTTSGAATVTLYDVPPDVTGTIVPGGSPVTVSNTTPGQNVLLSFSGAQNQRISLNVTNATIGCAAHIRVIRPDGVSVLYDNDFCASSFFIDPITLPENGTYTLQVDHNGATVGSATLALYDVPPDNQGSITPGGSSVTVTTTVPGQNATLDINSTLNQRVSLVLSNASIGCGGWIRILKPDSTILASNQTCSTGAYIDTQTLSDPGVYKVLVDYNSSTTGSATLTLHNVPPDVTGSVTINGSAVPVTITTPGQNASLTFDGTLNQQVTVRITSNTASTVTVQLLQGMTVLTSTTSSASSFNLATQTLPATQSYTVFVNPSVANTGSLNVSVTSP